MKTTTTLLVSVILLTSASSKAQTKIGLTAGASFATVTAKIQNISISPKSRTGFTAGIFADVPMSSNFGFMPGINFVQKGFKSKDEELTDKVGYNYLEVPLNFVYTAKSNGGFFIGAGPSIAFGLSGKEKMLYTTGSSENTKIKFGSGDEEIKRIDFGANVLTGYTFPGGFMISANYNLGLNNIQNGNADEMGTIKNRYFAAKIGYVLNGGKHK